MARRLVALVPQDVALESLFAIIRGRTLTLFSLHLSALFWLLLLFDHLVGEREQVRRHLSPSALAVLRFTTSSYLLGC
jgi:hypothetical protein